MCVIDSNTEFLWTSFWMISFNFSLGFHTTVPAWHGVANIASPDSGWQCVIFQGNPSWSLQVLLMTSMHYQQFNHQQLQWVIRQGWLIKRTIFGDSWLNNLQKTNSDLASLFFLRSENVVSFIAESAWAQRKKRSADSENLRRYLCVTLSPSLLHSCSLRPIQIMSMPL